MLSTTSPDVFAPNHVLAMPVARAAGIDAVELVAVHIIAGPNSVTTAPPAGSTSTSAIDAPAASLSST